MTPEEMKALIARLREDSGDYGRHMRGEQSNAIYSWDQRNVRAWETADALESALSSHPDEEHEDWCHVMTGCTEKGHCTCERAFSSSVSQTPQARVVPRPFDSDCAIGICARKCSHLMWECKACSSEGGWGAPREKLELMAAEHVCPNDQEDP